MSKIINFLDGKKSYIIAIAMGVTTTLHVLGILNDTAYQTAMGILTGGGIASLKSAISKNVVK